MSERVVVHQFDSVIEAQALQSVLESRGIESHVETLHLATTLPHMTQSLGGVGLTVSDSDLEEASHILSGLDPAEPVAATVEDERDDHRMKFHRIFKRGVASAIVGTFFLPVVANLFSLDAFREAYRHDRALFAGRRGTFLVAMVFNVLGFAVAGALVYSYLTQQN